MVFVLSPLMQAESGLIGVPAFSFVRADDKLAISRKIAYPLDSPTTGD